MFTESRPPRLRYFTPSEANALLPIVAGLVTQAAALLREVRELRDRAREPDNDERERTTLLARAHERREEAEDLIQQIADHGVEVKGIDPALLDFPAQRHGQEVLLCWREGETRVAWWHPLHTGFEGRRPLDFGELGSWEWVN